MPFFQDLFRSSRSGANKSPPSVTDPRAPVDPNHEQGAAAAAAQVTTGPETEPSRNTNLQKEGEVADGDSAPPPMYDPIVSTPDRGITGAPVGAYPPAAGNYLPPPPPPGHQMAGQMSQAGMGLGMADAMMNPNGPNMGAGMVDGMVVGNIIGQRIDQARNHAYWRQRQQEYLAGNKAAVVNTGVPMTEREAKREERRRRRWDRRGQ